MLGRRVPTGEVLSVSSSDSDTFGATLEVLARAIGSLLAFGLVCVLMFTTSPKLAVVVLHGEVQRINAAEIVGVEHVLGADAAAGTVDCAAQALNASAQAMAAASEADNREDSLALARLMRTLDELPKPTLARVHGAAFGGGVGLVACCDIAIASTAARFGLTATDDRSVTDWLASGVLVRRHASRVFIIICKTAHLSAAPVIHRRQLTAFYWWAAWASVSSRMMPKWQACAEASLVRVAPTRRR